LVRLGAGATVLWCIIQYRIRGFEKLGVAWRHWQSSALLFLYAIAFAYAYVNLSAGTGALILFSAVQLTMIALGLRAGEWPAPIEWCGWAAALMGLIYLVSPGVAAPSLGGTVLMAVAGIAWGAYSFIGRGACNPVGETAVNFLVAVPLALFVALIRISSLVVTPKGLLWAGLSGALTSGAGYAIWYAVLPRFTATQAATVQLAVPVIAAAGGILWLKEEVTWPLVIAAAMILGGIGVSLRARHGHISADRFREKEHYI
jgi:drug/metabolite transporter (DMT)-like permease